LRPRNFHWILIGACCPMLSLGAVAQVSLYTAVDMALRGSTAVRLAETDVRKAAAVLSETRDAYLPNLVVGSSLGYSYGFPIGQPSVYNVSSQSLLFTFSQKDYTRSARAALQSTEFALKDARQQVVLDTSLDYIQLDTTTRQIDALTEQKNYAAKLVAIEQQRVDAGVENRTELIRSELIEANVNLKAVHLQAEAEDLRAQLAHLTGLLAAGFTTVPQSIPAAPEYRAGSDLQASIMDNSGVQASYAAAKAREYTAFGDARQNWRPQFGVAAAYSRFAKFNNYAQYYQHFQHNNFGIGVQINLPLFDPVKRSKARESIADAAHASAQADQDRDLASERIEKMQRSLDELAAQRRVAQLERDLAQAELDSVTTQLKDGAGSPNAPALTPKDEQAARIEERQRYGDMLDADFSVIRVELTLLRASGSIEDWAKHAPQP
jgi:outer membrane protein TolC